MKSCSPKLHYYPEILLELQDEVNGMRVRNETNSVEINRDLTTKS